MAVGVQDKVTAKDRVPDGDTERERREAVLDVDGVAESVVNV